MLEGGGETQNKQIFTWLYTVLELFAFVEVFRVIFISPKPWKLELYYILCFALLFLLFVLKKGYLSRIVDNNLSTVLGKYTYSIYMSQYLIQILFVDGNKLTKFPIFSLLRANYPLIELLVIYILLPVMLGIVVYHCIEVPFNKKIRKLIFANLYNREVQKI